MDVIEKAARALCESSVGDANVTDSQGEPFWRSFVDDVKVVIGALKNPEPISVDHLGSISCGYRCGMEGGYDSAVEAWNDTIDEMLKSNAGGQPPVMLDVDN